MNKKKWIIFIILILIFGLLALLATQNKLDEFDYFIYDTIIFRRSNFLTILFKFITYLASGVTIILLSFVFFLVFKRYGFLILLNVFNLLFLNTVLKLIFMRDRPFDLMIINETGYSFPSGHAMMSLGFYGFIMFLISKSKINKRFKNLCYILFSILILLIGISRIYLGVHYASDVLAGFVITLAYLIFYINIVLKEVWYAKNDSKISG